MQFDWDHEKAERNFQKHEVSFQEAKTAFDDPFCIDFFDPDHSDEEKRFILVGQSSESRLLFVSYTERANKVRIISARQVTPRERRDYEYGRFE